MNADKKIKKSSVYLCLSCFILLIFLMAWLGFPDIIRCPYKTATGRPCLFCGTLTSFSLVAHGRIKEALKFNPIGALVFIGLLVICIIYCIRVFYEWIQRELG